MNIIWSNFVFGDQSIKLCLRSFFFLNLWITKTHGMIKLCLWCWVVYGWIQVISLDEALCEIRHRCRYSRKRSHAVICWQMRYVYILLGWNLCFVQHRWVQYLSNSSKKEKSQHIRSNSLKIRVSEYFVSSNASILLGLFFKEVVRARSYSGIDNLWNPQWRLKPAFSSLISSECVLCRWQFFLFRFH